MAEEKDIVQLLLRHGVKPTSNRIIVARALADEAYPSSLKELEERIVTIDKSGIFRALTLFRQQHLVHAIEDEGGTRYELCHSHHDDGDDDDQHVHFHCSRCGRVFCLYDQPLPHVALPHGFTADSANYIITGICEECNNKPQ